MVGKLELVRKRTVLNAVRSYSCVSNGRGLVVKQSIAAGTVVIALGKLAVITEVKNTEQVSVRINDTGETKIVAVADVEIIPEEQETITQLTTYDPADPKEAMKLIAAAEQAVILKEYFNGDMTQNEAAQKLSLKKSAFYKLASRFNHALGALSIIKNSPGAKTGSHRIPEAVVAVVKECFDRHYQGAAASYSHVWKQTQAACAEKGLPPPGLSTVQRLIKKMDPKIVFRQKYGLDATNQRFQTRPGYVHTDYPLQHAQMDHTRVDLILRAEHDRSLTIGRPWVTLLIDVHTRIILGFYLSMFAPSLVSVQQTVCMAALPKKKSPPTLPPMGLAIPITGCLKNWAWTMPQNFILRFWRQD